jgi:hypothetical protein
MTSWKRTRSFFHPFYIETRCNPLDRLSRMGRSKDDWKLHHSCLDLFAPEIPTSSWTSSAATGYSHHISIVARMPLHQPSLGRPEQSHEQDQRRHPGQLYPDNAPLEQDLMQMASQANFSRPSDQAFLRGLGRGRGGSTQPSGWTHWCFAALLIKDGGQLKPYLHLPSLPRTRT